MFGWIKRLFSGKKPEPQPDWLDREFSIYAPPATAKQPSKVVMARGGMLTPAQSAAVHAAEQHNLHPRHSIRPAPAVSTPMRREVPPISINAPSYERTTQRVITTTHDQRTDDSFLRDVMLVQALASSTHHTGCDERVKQPEPTYAEPELTYTEPARAPEPTPSYSYTEPSSSSYSSCDSSSSSSCSSD